MKSARARYREYLPAPALRPYVACYWTSTAPGASSSHRVLPDGCIDILFDLTGEQYPDATVIGAMTRPLLFETSSPVEMVAVRFRPGGAVPFLRLSAHEITDSNARLADVWQTDRLAERIRGEDDNTRRVRQLEAALLGRLADSRELDPRIQAAVSWLKEPGRSVEGAAATVDVSRQHLARLFKRHVGVSPKQFARVLRMQRLRSRVRRLSRPDWPAVALAVGYYDQAHMIAECRALAGATPTELLKR
jgi:AraC-like DNA-binding protein